MRNVDEAVSLLGDIAGIAPLTFGADGQLALIFAGAVEVILYRIDDANLELHTQLRHVGGEMSRERLVALLVGNYLGDSTGAGRFSLDPRDETVCFGLRIDVTTIDGSGLEAAMLSFVNRAAALDATVAGGSVTRPEPATALGSTEDEMMFRA